MRLPVLLITIVFLNSGLTAQKDSAVMVKYTPEYRFNDGLFLNFSQVKNNKPVPATRISSTTDPYSVDFYNNLISKEQVVFFDEFGAQQEINTTSIWGFARDGKLHINYNGEFNRIPIVGRIGHFISDITVYEQQYDPYYRDYYDYYYYRNPHYNRNYPRTTRSKEMRQYLIDFESGKVVSYDLDEVKAILMDDPELFDEFNTLKRRKQKDLMFFFIRRYNENHPLYLPVR